MNSILSSDISLKGCDDDLPTISVVIPCRNEAEIIEKTLHSWLANDYPADRLEIFVVDGMSDDGTREIVEKIAREHSCVRLLDNPSRIAPVAMNIGIRQSTGQLIIIISGHALVESHYLRECVRVLREHPDAGRAGGYMETVNPTYWGKIIAAATTNPIGVGGSNWRLNKPEGYTDDAAFGAYHRWVYEKVGLYDEQFVRNQDTDFIQRVNDAGIKTYCSPTIRCTYYTRSTLSQLARQHYFDGFWLVKNLLKLHRTHPRRLVPFLFVLGWFVLLLMSLTWPWGKWLLGAYAACYLITVCAGAVMTVPRYGWKIAVLVPLAFAVMHFSYGLGTLHGIWSWGVLRGRFQPRPESYSLTR